MGVTCVTQWNVADIQNVHQSIEELQTLMENLGAKKSGLFVVECESFHSTNAQNSKTLHTIYNSQFPASRFAMFEDGAFLTADVMLVSFLSKLRDFWQPRKGGKIESKGNCYLLGDFLIKVGIVTVGPSTKGVSIEVEFAPCIYPRDCWELVMEMVQTLIGDQAPTTLPTIILQKPDTTLAELMAWQYVDMFNNIRKSNVPR